MSFLGLGAVSSGSIQHAWFSFPWLLSVRGLLMGIVTRRVVECAFLTRLSCQSMLAVVLLPLLLPVRLRGANSLSTSGLGTRPWSQVSAG